MPNHHLRHEFKHWDVAGRGSLVPKTLDHLWKNARIAPAVPDADVRIAKVVPGPDAEFSETVPSLVQAIDIAEASKECLSEIQKCVVAQERTSCCPYRS